MLRLQVSSGGCNVRRSGDLVGCLGSGSSLAGSPRDFHHERSGLEWEVEIQ